MSTTLSLFGWLRRSANAFMLSLPPTLEETSAADKSRDNSPYSHTLRRSAVRFSHEGERAWSPMPYQHPEAPHERRQTRLQPRTPLRGALLACIRLPSAHHGQGRTDTRSRTKEACKTDRSG